MANIERWFLRVAVIYALLAMALGIAMGISEDHSQAPTHAHLNLVGWVSMAIYALVYRQWPSAGQSKLALIHFWTANAGAILLNLGVYGLMSGSAALAPVAVAGSLVTIAGMLIFAFIVYTKV
jgi:cbb3-type cytochrome oxidase subunit 1